MRLRDIPTDHPHSHMFWSTVISLIAVALGHLVAWQAPQAVAWANWSPWWLCFAGPLFYGVRELWQWGVQLKDWDSEGFMWGVFPPYGAWRWARSMVK